ncbi:armadillo-type protein [Schizophyllum amplum]|uniref:Armadillo-type protein n=1 Tax=Schizophyllum amplum TaxID=97359 RepID=A0A550C4T2_9AGAR|nr:armadillo-type protein [Auriculariopsis ampla]
MSASPTSAMSVDVQKRKRSPSEEGEHDAPPATRRRSASPSSSAVPRINDSDPARRAERERQLAAREGPECGRKSRVQQAAEHALGWCLHAPSPSARAASCRCYRQTSPEYQRLAWDALRKSITGIVNRVNTQNIKQVIPELFQENLIRGRGLFARSIMKAQAASLPFTPVFAALVAVLNTKLPQVGELLLTRLISQFRKSFKRNDKTICHSTTTFIAHLVNQGVAHEIIALQILVLLLERPTDDSIEIAVGFMREVGAFLQENSPKGNTIAYERFLRKDRYKDNPILPEGLDLVEEDEQITHQIHLEEELQVQEGLNIFKFDADYLENEDKYKSIKAEILGEGSDEEEESGSEESSEESDDEGVAEEKEGIEDRTATNITNLRRVIYLTIMNALNYEEAVHKLLKVQMNEGEEIELVKMIIECCSQERSYSTFYGLVGERFSKLNRVWTDCFEEAFTIYYETIHQYETNRLRNIARFFGHLFASDAISWNVLRVVKVNEDDTTSSSRIFIKIMMNEMMEAMGLKGLAERLKDPEIRDATRDMFPMDIPKNTRFSINYFTSIGLGLVTEEMREYLKVCSSAGPLFRLLTLCCRTHQGSLWSNARWRASPPPLAHASSETARLSPSTRWSHSQSPPRRRRDDSPPPRRRHSPSRSPPRRRGPRDDVKMESASPPPRRRDSRAMDDSPPRRRDSPPRYRGDSPPRRRRDDSPPGDRGYERDRGYGRDRSPPPHMRDRNYDRRR